MLTAVLISYILYRYIKSPKLNHNFFDRNRDKFLLVYDETKDYYLLRSQYSNNLVKIFKSDHEGYYISATVNNNQIFYSNIIKLKHFKKFLKIYNLKLKFN